MWLKIDVGLPRVLRAQNCHACLILYVGGWFRALPHLTVTSETAGYRLEGRDQALTLSAEAGSTGPACSDQLQIVPNFPLTLHHASRLKPQDHGLLLTPPFNPHPHYLSGHILILCTHYQPVNQSCRRESQVPHFRILECYTFFSGVQASSPF
jgi:hypothetical protein